MKRILHLGCQFAIAISTIAPTIGDDSTPALRAPNARHTHEVEARVMRALLKPVSVDWQDIPLSELVAQLEESFGVRVKLDLSVPEDTKQRLTPDIRVSLTLNDVPLREILNKLTLVVRHLTWAVRGNHILLKSDEDDESAHFVRVYDASKILRRRSEQEVLDIVHARQEFEAGNGFFSLQPEPVDSHPPAEQRDLESPHISPHDYYAFDQLEDVICSFLDARWRSDGNGFGTINTSVVGGRPLLVVRQSFSAHTQLTTLLAQLESASDIDIEPRIADPRIKADREWAQQNARREVALLEKLYTTRVSVDWRDTPLSAALGELEERHGFNVLIDREGLEDIGITPDETVTSQAKNVVLFEAFDLAMQCIEDIDCHVDGSTVVVTSAERTPSSLRVYDVTTLVERRSRVAPNHTDATGEAFVWQPGLELGQRFATNELFELVENFAGGDRWRSCSGECYEARSLEFKDRVAFVAYRNTASHRKLAILLDRLRSNQQKAQR